MQNNLAEKEELEVVEVDEDDRAPLFGSTKRRQKSM